MVKTHSHIIKTKTGVVFLAENGRRYFTINGAYSRTAASRIKKLRPCPGHVIDQTNVKCDSRCHLEAKLFKRKSKNVGKSGYYIILSRYAKKLKFADRNAFDAVKKVNASFYVSESGKRVLTKRVAFYLTAIYRARKLYLYSRALKFNYGLILVRYSRLLTSKFKAISPEEWAIKEILKL